MADEAARQRIAGLSCWQGAPEIMPLGGGRTNLNFTVQDQQSKYVVRFGEDIPEHHVMRFNELAASRAGHAAGLSPAVVLAEPGITVFDFIECKTLDEQDVAKPEYLGRIVDLVRACHFEMPKHFRGPALVFWVFHVIRDYAATLVIKDSAYVKKLPDFIAIAQKLEKAAGPFDIVFGHNDLMAANILDDGTRLWLIDWDYAGFNSPLFDLGGLASNNQFDEAQEHRLLDLYYQGPVEGQLWRRYHAMKCASLLRETLWSMVSEVTSDLDVDFVAYTAENLARFERAYDTYLQT